MQSEIAENSAYLAESFLMQQQLAQDQLPQLQTLLSGIQEQNEIRDSISADLERRLVDVCPSSEAMAASRRTKQRVAFESLNGEKMAVLDDLQRQIDACEAQVSEIGEKMRDQRSIHATLKKQIAEGIADLGDTMKLALRVQGLRAMQSGMQEQTKMLHLELDYYANRIRKAEAIVTKRNVGKLEALVAESRRRLTIRKATFDRWMKHTKRHAMPLTHAPELDRIQAEINELAIQQGNTERRRSVIATKIHRAIKLLESWGITIPCNRLV
jgi:hypothetical protein